MSTSFRTAPDVAIAYPYPQLGPAIVAYLLACDQITAIVGNCIVPHKLERQDDDVPAHIIYYQDGNLTDRFNIRDPRGRREVWGVVLMFQIGSRDYGELEYLCQCVRSRMDGLNGVINLSLDPSLQLSINECRLMTVDENRQSGVEEFMDEVGVYVRYMAYRLVYLPRVPDLRGQQ